MGFTARYISDGRYLDYTAPSDVAAGDVVVVGELVGVAVEPIAAGRMDGLCVDGVVDFVGFLDQVLLEFRVHKPSVLPRRRAKSGASPGISGRGRGP